MPVRERVGDTPDAPVVVRTPDDELASVMIDHGIGGPVRSDRILPRTSGDAMRRLRTLVEGENLAAARQTLAVGLRSPGFEAAFERGDVRGWPVGVLPNLPDLPVRALNRIHGGIPEVLSKPGIITDRVAPRKLARKHPTVTAETYRLLQLALDRGELLARGARARIAHPSLIAHVPREVGGWWRFAIRIETDRRRLRLATIFDQSEYARQTLLDGGNVVVLRRWDRRRWDER